MTDIAQRLRFTAEANRLMVKYLRENASNRDPIVTQHDMHEAANLMDEAANEVERPRCPFIVVSYGKSVDGKFTQPIIHGVFFDQESAEITYLIVKETAEECSRPTVIEVWTPDMFHAAPEGGWLPITLRPNFGDQPSAIQPDTNEIERLPPVYVVSDPVVDLAHPNYGKFDGQIIIATMDTREIRPHPTIRTLRVRNTTDHYVDIYCEDGSSVSIPPIGYEEIDTR